jgi:hypothetical protein
VCRLGRVGAADGPEGPAGRCGQVEHALEHVVGRQAGHGQLGGAQLPPRRSQKRDTLRRACAHVLALADKPTEPLATCMFAAADRRQGTQGASELFNQRVGRPLQLRENVRVCRARSASSDMRQLWQRLSGSAGSAGAADSVHDELMRLAEHLRTALCLCCRCRLRRKRRQGAARHLGEHGHADDPDAAEGGRDQARPAREHAEPRARKHLLHGPQVDDALPPQLAAGRDVDRGDPGLRARGRVGRRCCAVVVRSAARLGRERRACLRC